METIPPATPTQYRTLASLLYGHRPGDEFDWDKWQLFDWSLHLAVRNVADPSLRNEWGAVALDITYWQLAAYFPGLLQIVNAEAKTQGIVLGPKVFKLREQGESKAEESEAEESEVESEAEESEAESEPEEESKTKDLPPEVIPTVKPEPLKVVKPELPRVVKPEPSQALKKTGIPTLMQEARASEEEPFQEIALSGNVMSYTWSMLPVQRMTALNRFIEGLSSIKPRSEAEREAILAKIAIFTFIRGKMAADKEITYAYVNRFNGSLHESEELRFSLDSPSLVPSPAFFSYKITPDKYTWEEDHVFVNFAADTLGGGILGSFGWVQEEFATAGLSVFPFIGHMRKRYTDLGESPIDIHCSANFTMNTAYYGAEGLRAALRAKKNAPAFNPFQEKEPQYIPIHWLSMTAVDIARSGRSTPLYTAHKEMVARAIRSFCLAMASLKTDRTFVLHTGNWGAGAFGWRAKVVHDIQMLGFGIAMNSRFRTRYRKEHVDIRYHAYDQLAMESILVVRDTWGVPCIDDMLIAPKSKDHTEYMMDTVYFNKPTSAYYVSISVGGSPQTRKYDYAHFAPLANTCTIENKADPDITDFGAVTSSGGVKLRFVETFFQAMNVLFSDAPFEDKNRAVEELAKVERRDDARAVPSTGLAQVDARELKRIAGAFTPHPDWFSRIRFEVMLHAVRRKIRSKPAVLQRLLDTGHMHIVEEAVHRTHQDGEWGNGEVRDFKTNELTRAAGLGANYLGQILMHVRKEEALGQRMELVLYKEPRDFFAVHQREILPNMLPHIPSGRTYKISVPEEFIDLRYDI